MRRSAQFFLLLALLAGLPLNLRAQISGLTVDLVCDQHDFLPNETIDLGVRIANTTGRDLTFGTQPGWLTFVVEANDDFPVQAIGEIPVLGEFQVASATRVTKRGFNIAPYFEIANPGRYRVSVILRMPEWGLELVSPPLVVNIIHGSVLWEREFGVPPAPGEPAGAPEFRRFVLQQARYLDNVMMLYVRLTDANGFQTYSVQPVARMTSFSQPEVQMDKFNNLHVLHQTGRVAFNYSVFTTDGRLLIQQRHDYTQSRPHLGATDSGLIQVVGGARVPTPYDLPATSAAALPPSTSGDSPAVEAPVSPNATPANITPEALPSAEKGNTDKKKRGWWPFRRKKD